MRITRITWRPVAKKDPKTGEILEIYRSARSAAMANYCCNQTMLRALHKQNKKRPGIGPDGYLYEWYK